MDRCHYPGSWGAPRGHFWNRWWQTSKHHKFTNDNQYHTRLFTQHRWQPLGSRGFYRGKDFCSQQFRRMWFNSRLGRQPGRACGGSKITEEMTNEAHRLMNQLEEMQLRIHKGMMKNTEFKSQEVETSRAPENEVDRKAANEAFPGDEIDLITLRRRKGPIEKESTATSELISTEAIVENEPEVHHDVIELPGPVQDATPAIESDTSSNVMDSQQIFVGHYRDASRVQELVNSIPERIEPVVVKPKPVSSHGKEPVHISKKDLDIDTLDSSQIRSRYAKKPDVEKEAEHVQQLEPEKLEVQISHLASRQAEAENTPAMKEKQPKSCETQLNEHSSAKTQAQFDINPSKPYYTSARSKVPLSEPETRSLQNKPSKVTPTSGKDLATEYIILTRKQKMIKTAQLPLSPDEIAEYTFPVLSSLENPSRYARSITKLERQGWRIIGGGGDLIVFERAYDRRRRARRTRVRRGLAIVGSVGLLGASILAMNERPSTEVKPQY